MDAQPTEFRGVNPQLSDEAFRQLFARQNDYFRYLYEQELKRAENIVNGAKVYIALLVFLLGSIFLKVIPLEMVARLVDDPSVSVVIKLTGGFLVICSTLALILALTLSILVFKVWSYERLCNPVRRLSETMVMNSDIDVLSKSITDFAVATHQNFSVNNKRAQYLSKALVFLLLGVALSLVTATYLNLTLLPGGQ